jgi:hypothetical protein
MPMHVFLPDSSKNLMRFTNETRRSNPSVDS